MEGNNYGMGGVGLVSATPMNGYIYNPALNAAYQDDEDDTFFYMSIGAQVVDTTNTQENIQIFSEKFDTSILEQTNTNMESTIDALRIIDGQQPSSAVLGSVGLTFNHQALALSIFYQTKGFGFIYTDISENDISFLGETGNLFDYLVNESNPINQAQAISDFQAKYGILPQNFDTFSFQSNFTLSAVQINEYGINFGTSLDDPKSRWLLGITIKKQEVITFSFINTIDDEFDFSNINNIRDISEYYDGANVDIGFRYELFEDLIYVAGTINNLFSGQYPLPLSNGYQADYLIHPVMNVGVAYLSDLINVEINAQVNPEQHFDNFKGYETPPQSDDTQIVNFGVEAHILFWLKLRMGYFYDINHVIKERLTVGLGLSPFDLVHVDVGLSYKDLTNLTATTSVGISF